MFNMRPDGSTVYPGDPDFLLYHPGLEGSAWAQSARHAFERWITAERQLRQEPGQAEAAEAVVPTVVYEAGLDPDESRYVQLKDRLVEVNDDLIRYLAKHPSAMKELHHRDFEHLVAELLAKQGFRVEVTRATCDGGADIRALQHDALGTHLYLVECKHYSASHPVGVTYVRALYGVVSRTAASAGVLVTTSRFTRDAEEFARGLEHRMTLRDYNYLVQWVQDVTGQKPIA